MLAINLAIRFLIELAVLMFIGVWGFTMDGPPLFLKGVIGIGCPLIVAVLWGLFVAPKAPFSIPIPLKMGIELIIFLFGIWVVYSLFDQLAAFILAAMMVLNSSYVHYKINFSQKRTL